MTDDAVPGRLATLFELVLINRIVRYKPDDLLYRIAEIRPDGTVRLKPWSPGSKFSDQLIAEPTELETG